MSDQKEQAAELKTYHGSCHCGNAKFSVQLAPITTVFACNCSICSRVCMPVNLQKALWLVFHYLKHEVVLF